MKKHIDASINDALEIVERDPIRGPLFWWFYDNHADMLRRAAGKRVNWTELCPRLVRLGLTDQTGKPMTTQTARRTWARVCQVKSQEQALRDKRRGMRCRESERGPNADRPPPVVTTPMPRPPVPYYPPPSPSMPSTEGTAHSRSHEALSKEERLAEARAEVLRLRRVFAVRSGHDPDKIK